MRPGAIGIVAALVLAGCEYAPEPYQLNPRPYTIPFPEVPAPVTEAPLPQPPGITRLPPPPAADPALPDATQPEMATPVPPPADLDPPRDPVEDVLLKPPADDTPAPTAIQASPPRNDPIPPPDTGGAVPLMGFRPMRGQKPPGA